MEDPTTMIQGDELEVENATVIFEGDYQRIFRYMMSMVRDTAEAEDLTQETFLRAYHRARRKLATALEAGCAFSYDERNVLTCESKH